MVETKERVKTKVETKVVEPTPQATGNSGMLILGALMALGLAALVPATVVASTTPATPEAKIEDYYLFDREWRPGHPWTFAGEHAVALGKNECSKASIEFNGSRVMRTTLWLYRDKATGDIFIREPYKGTLVVSHLPDLYTIIDNTIMYYITDSSIQKEWQQGLKDIISEHGRSKLVTLLRQILLENTTQDIRDELLVNSGPTVG